MRINYVKADASMLEEKKINALVSNQVLSFKDRLLRINQNCIETLNIKETYCPYYFCEITALAARTPFKPKKRLYVLFLNGSSGIAGVTDKVPDFNYIDVCEEQLLHTKHSMEDKEKLNELKNTFVYKLYLLKKPELLEGEVVKMYFPFWVIDYKFQGKKGKVLINRLSGEKI